MQLRAIDFVMGVSVALVWGMGFVFAKAAIAHFPPILLMSLRFAVTAVALVWFGDVRLGVVIGCAMIINLFVAGLSGILIPLALDRLKMDPAISSSVFLTTVTDVVGFFAFLGLAAWWLL